LTVVVEPIRFGGIVWERGFHYGTGEVRKVDEKIEISVPAEGDSAGLVSAEKYDLRVGKISARFYANDVNSVGTWISPIKYTGSHPDFLDNAYHLLLGTRGTAVRFRKRVNGVFTEIAAIGITPDTFFLRYEISEGKIRAYINDRLLGEDDWAFDTYECYIYLHGHGALGELGTCWIDNFSMEYYKPAPPITTYLIPLAIAGGISLIFMFILWRRGMV